MEIRLYPLALSLCVIAALTSGCADYQRPQTESHLRQEKTKTVKTEQPTGNQRPVTENVAVPIDSPWRNAGKWRQMQPYISFSRDNLWDWAPQRYRLAQLAPQRLDGIERAEARLRLARLGPHYSLWARQNVVQSQQMLTDLMTRSPSTPGLLKAVVDANRSYHWYDIDDETEFYKAAKAYIEKRWQAGRGDAAEAGYRLSQILAATSQSAKIEAEYRLRLDVLDKVVNGFPNTEWAVQAAFDRISLQEQLDSWSSNEVRGDTHLRKYVAFADEHPGHPLAARALWRAAQSYGFGDYGEAQHSGLPNIPRLERAMELHVRYQREYPNAAPHNSNERSTEPEPAIQVWGEPDADADTVRLEQLAQEYYALNPRGATTLITTLASLKQHAAEPLPLSERPTFYRRFWSAVEGLARPTVLPDVRLARAWFLTEGEPYSTPEARGEQLQEASAILVQVCKEFPRSDAAAVALDALALLAIQLERPQQALRYWDELAAQVPDHPLNRPAAVDRLFLKHPTQKGAVWRFALKELQRQFPDDPLMALVARCMRAQSFVQDGVIAAARGEYEAALEPWTAVFPLDRIGIASQTLSLGPLHEVRAGLLRQAGLIPEEPPSTDLRLLSRQAFQTPEERIAAYSEVLELFPESAHSLNHMVFLADALLDAGRLNAALKTFRRVADDQRCDPDTRLFARTFEIRLAFQLSQSPSANDDVGKLMAALEEHCRMAPTEKPRDQRGRDVAALYRHAYADQSDRRSLEAFVSPNTANKWFVVTGSDSIEVEFHDGLLLNYAMTPPLPPEIADRAISLADPALLLNALGVGDPQAAEFIEQVVGRVFVMNTEENRELANEANQKLRIPSENDLALPPVGPLIVTRRPTFLRFVFYDEQCSHAEVHVPPRTDVSEVLFYARRNGTWESSDAQGWFRWGR